MDYTYIIAIVQLIITGLLPEHRSPIFPMEGLLGLLKRYSIANGNTTAGTISALAPTEDIVKEFGYPIEIHHIVNKGGYVLTLHRIPQQCTNKTTGKASAEKLPFVLIPGLLGDSTNYIIKRTSGGIVFAHAGHDVWLVNNRGTRYSRKHIHLNPDMDKKYWDFSFHEMGAEDMPLIVDYILSKSKATELYLVGHSMGGAIASIFLAENPAYSRNVKAIFLLAPALNVTHTHFPLSEVDQTTIHEVLEIIFNDMEVPLTSVITADLALHHCKNPIESILCQKIIRLFGETGTDDLGESMYYKMSLCAAGSSVKTFRHFMQMISSTRFAHYDYGTKCNLQKYGDEKPSDYDLNSIKVPTYMYYSLGDTFVDAYDLLAVGNKLGNLVKLICVTRNNANIPFTHYDFAIANEAQRLVYEPILMEIGTLRFQSNLQWTETTNKPEQIAPQLQHATSTNNIPIANTTNSSSESQNIYNKNFENSGNVPHTHVQYNHESTTDNGDNKSQSVLQKSTINDGHEESALNAKTINEHDLSPNYKCLAALMLFVLLMVVITVTSLVRREKSEKDVFLP